MEIQDANLGVEKRRLDTVEEIRGKQDSSAHYFSGFTSCWIPSVRISLYHKLLTLDVFLASGKPTGCFIVGKIVASGQKIGFPSCVFSSVGVDSKINFGET